MRIETRDNINMVIDIQEYVRFLKLKGTRFKRHIGMTYICVMMHHLLNDKEPQEYKKLIYFLNQILFIFCFTLDVKID